MRERASVGLSDDEHVDVPRWRTGLALVTARPRAEQERRLDSGHVFEAAPDSARRPERLEQEPREFAKVGRLLVRLHDLRATDALRFHETRFFQPRDLTLDCCRVHADLAGQ